MLLEGLRGRAALGLVLVGGASGAVVEHARHALAENRDRFRHWGELRDMDYRDLREHCASLHMPGGVEQLGTWSVRQADDGTRLTFACPWRERPGEQFHMSWAPEGHQP
ncbi:MAG: hypothetical protein JO086_00050 [Acidimicrobiia bacterium]|nr:hypothetical protein [Acidimicrobiia bacterium]